MFGWPTSCINIRFLSGGVYVGEFERRGGRVNMRVEGAIFDSSPHIVLAPLDGQSIAFLPEEEFASYMRKDVLYSHRRHSPAFSLVVEALRM